MIRSAIRSFLRSGADSLLNLTGLTVGLASALIITLFIWSEIGHDKFLPDYKNIYRITTQYGIKGNEANWALNHGIIDQKFKEELPGIENSTAFIKVQSEKVFTSGDKSLISSEGFYSDNDFFQVFDFPFLYGDKTLALNQPNTIVVTQSFAKKFFGTEDVINKMADIKEDESTTPLKVTGVIKDIPANSYVKFDFIISSGTAPNWDEYYSGISGNMFYIFFKLRQEMDTEELQLVVDETLTSWKRSKYGDDYVPSESFYHNTPVQRLDKIYFDARNEFEITPGGDKNYAILLLLVGAFILIISVINYVNLSISTSFSGKKIKEFAIRKLMGSSVVNLILKYTLEVSLVVLIAIILSVFLVNFLLDVFLATQFQVINPFSENNFYLSLIFAWIILSISASIFPCMRFLSFSMMNSIKGKIQIRKESWLSLRNILVTLQVMLTAMLITNSTLLYRQLNFLSNTDVGYKTNQIIEVKRSSDMNYAEWRAFLTKAKDLAQMVSVGSSTFAHISDMSNAEVVTSRAGSPTVKVAWNGIDYDFIPTMEMEITKGRNFSSNLPSDVNAVIINETAAQSLGIEDPIGETIIHWGNPLKIIGVVNDFHFQSFNKPISPLIFILREGYTSVGYIHYVEDTPSNSLSQIATLWKSSGQSAPFEYRFLEDNFHSLTEKEEKISTMVTAFTFVAIILSVLGLVGLIGFDANQKKKEIAIKKILGASVNTLVILLNKRFLVIIVMGLIISMPLAIWAGNYWLNVFVYKITPNWQDVAFSLLVIVMVGVITSSIITLKATHSNPVEVIRNE